MFSILYPFSKLTIFGSHLRHILSELVSPTSRIFFQEAGFTALFFPCPGLQFKSHNHSVSISLQPPPLPATLSAVIAICLPSQDAVSFPTLQDTCLQPVL